MKKTSKVLIVALLVFLLCGCTKTLKGEDNKAVVNEKTGQTVTENIVCKPKDEDVIKLYEENKVDLSK